MDTTLTRSLALALGALLALPLTGSRPASAQDAPASKDDVLDSLLKKLEEKDAKPKPEADDSKPKAAKPKGEASRPSKKGDASPGKPSGEVSGKDKDLDSLLEKLGTTEDKASPDEKRGGGGGEPKPDTPPGPEKPGDGKNRPEALTGKTRDLDQHLEELTGKRRKKNRRDEEDSGPLSEVIKEMRDVEQRLSKPDTGEETRKKQTQIVKRIETLIEQARASSGRSSGKPKKSMAMRPGQQPGGLEEQPGNTGGNAPFTRPKKPTDRRSLAGGKETWGHLPPELRQEMDNVFKEDPLPSREELIKRYYLSVSQKTLTRGR